MEDHGADRDRLGTQYVGDELRQVRAAAWHARLAGLRAAAEARAGAQRGDHGHAATQRKLAASYQALELAYREREAVFTQTMADRADWETATRAQRQLTIAADAELHRRHPGQHFVPLRSAEPQPATEAQRDEPTLTPASPAASRPTTASAPPPTAGASPPGPPTVTSLPQRPDLAVAADVSARGYGPSQTQG